MHNDNNDILRSEARYRRLTKTPVPRLVLSLAVPTIISMSISAIYNIVDSWFVGHISTVATAGVGVAFAYQSLIQATGFFFGHGSGNYMSRALGARDAEGAGKMAATGFLSSFLIGIVFMVLGMLFVTPLSRLLGATPDVVPYSNAYLRWILIATPFLISQMTLNNQLRLQGNAMLAMIGIAVGMVLNIFFDWLLIPVGYGSERRIIGHFDQSVHIMVPAAVGYHTTRKRSYKPAQLCPFTGALPRDWGGRTAVADASVTFQHIGHMYELGCCQLCTAGAGSIHDCGLYRGGQDNAVRNGGDTWRWPGIPAGLRIQLGSPSVRTRKAIIHVYHTGMRDCADSDVLIGIVICS